MSNRVLVLLAHPNFEASRINRALVSAAATVAGVTVHDLYESYPEQMIDVAREQKILSGHDVLVLQHPLYWYSCPALLKNWIDAVLEYGWAHGEGGTALQGKSWVHAVSSGSAHEDYQRSAYHRFSIPEFLRPFEQSASLCGMHYLDPFMTHNVHRMDGEAISTRAKAYCLWLEALVAGNMPATVHTVHSEAVHFCHDV